MWVVEISTNPPPPSSLHNDNGYLPLISLCFSSVSEAGSGFANISKQELGGGGEGWSQIQQNIKTVAFLLVKPHTKRMKRALMLKGIFLHFFCFFIKFCFTAAKHSGLDHLSTKSWHSFLKIQFCGGLYLVY